MLPVHTNRTEKDTTSSVPDRARCHGTPALRPYDIGVNRVGTALLILLTAVVFGGVVYVLGHDTKVPEAGQTPGFSAPPQTTPARTPSTTQVPVSPSSSAAATSGSVSSSSSSGSVLIAFVGDDYTHGLGGSGGSATFPALVASNLHVQQKSFYLDNGGYAKTDNSGKTYADLVSAVIAAHPDVVVVSGGRNDRADDPNTLASKAAALFSALRQGLPNAKLVGVAPWWGDSAHPTALQSVDTAVKDGVTAAGGSYFDISDPLFSHPEWMANAADPNNAGYSAIAQSLESKLQALLPA